MIVKEGSLVKAIRKYLLKTIRDKETIIGYFSVPSCRKVRALLLFRLRFSIFIEKQTIIACYLRMKKITKDTLYTIHIPHICLCTSIFNSW